MKFHIINFLTLYCCTDRSGLNDTNTRCSNLGKHLSKSASELSCRDCSIESPNSSPQRAKSAANPAVTGVIQKTHGFFSTLKVRPIIRFCSQSDPVFDLF